MSAKTTVSRKLRSILGLDRDAQRTDRLRQRLTTAELATAYQAIATLSDRYRTGGTGLDLRHAELRVFSQNGEDGILCAILCALGIDQGRFIEFGTQDGTECCTRFLAEILGWSGTYLEPDPQSFADLERRWERTDRIVTLNVAATPDNIAPLVDDADLLVIDVDGQDHWIWQAITATPRVVVIEYNAELGDEIEPLGTPWTTPHRRSGTGLEPLRKLGESKGYRLVHTEACGVNAFFVRSDLPFVGITDRSVNHSLTGRGQPR